MREQEQLEPGPQARPVVSVLIVADHDTDRHAELADLRSCLQALAAQDVDEPVEFLLVETPERARTLPADVLALLPGLRVIGVPQNATYEQKNAGAQAAQGDIIALLDVDCIPVAGWLQSLITTFRAHPDYVAVSGRTRYEGTTASERCLSVLSRGFLDPGQEGPTRFISNNNSGFLREVYQRFPLPEGEGPYAAQLQSAAISRDGGRFLFQPAMTVIHDFEGWTMERDIRCHIGWATIRIRQIDPGLRFSWLLRLGQASIPLFYLGRVLESLGTCLRVGHHYGLRLTDYPLALGLTLWVHGLEINGMRLAFRHQRVDHTKYR